MMSEPDLAPQNPTSSVPPPASSIVSALLVVGAMSVFALALQGPLISPESLRLQSAATNAVTPQVVPASNPNATTPKGAAKETCTAEVQVKGDAEKRKIGKICTPTVKNLNPSDKQLTRLQAETNCKPSYEVPPGECWAKVCTPGYFGFESCTFVKRKNTADVETAAMESYKGNRPLSDILPNQFRDAEGSLCKNDDQCKLYAQNAISDAFRDTPKELEKLTPEDARKKAEQVQKELEELRATPECATEECLNKKKELQNQLVTMCDSITTGTKPAYCANIKKIESTPTPKIPDVKKTDDPNKQCPPGTVGVQPRCESIPPPPPSFQEPTKQSGPQSDLGKGTLSKMLDSLFNNQNKTQQPGTSASLQSPQTQQQLSCNIATVPSTVKKGEQVTLMWNVTGASSGNIYVSIAGLGAVPSQGSTVLSPSQSTSFVMAAQGSVQQQQPTYAYSGQQQYQVVNVPVSASCSARVDVTDPGTTPEGSGALAELSCAPKLADVGQEITLTYSCNNATEALGEGFDTGGKLSGETKTTIVSPETGGNTPSAVTYKLTCLGNNGRKSSNTCTARINKTSIIMIANPKEISSGEQARVGWKTFGMQSCTISSDELSAWSDEQKKKPRANGVVKTPELTEDTTFNLVCKTKTGGTKEASLTVELK